MTDVIERFCRTLLNEFYRIAFRYKAYRSIDETQVSPARIAVLAKSAPADPPSRSSASQGMAR